MAMKKSTIIVLVLLFVGLALMLTGYAIAEKGTLVLENGTQIHGIPKIVKDQPDRVEINGDPLLLLPFINDPNMPTFQFGSQTPSKYWSKSTAMERDVRTLEIDLALYDVYMKESKDDVLYVEYAIYKKSSDQYGIAISSNENGVVTLKTNVLKNNPLIDSRPPQIVIWMPKQARLGDVHIQNGSLEMNDTAIEPGAKITLNSGELILHQTKLEASEERTRLELSMGSLKLNNSSLSNVDLHLSMGDIQMDRTKLADIYADISMGNLEGNATWSGKNLVNLSMGSAELALQQPSSSLFLTAELSMGDTQVQDWGNPKSKDRIDFNLSFGDLKVHFEE